MTEEMFKENYKFFIRQQEIYKDDEINWAYFEGQIKILIAWASSILGYEKVRKLLDL